MRSAAGQPHCHATTEASGRLIADAGRRDFFHTGFLNYQTAPPGVLPLNARENLDIGNRFALVELLRNGCTTIVELGAVNDATVAFAGHLGIRAYLTPGYRSASYRMGPEGELGYEWDEEAGARSLARATAFDRSVMVFAVSGFSMPVFWLGFLLVWVFALQLGWLPVQGYSPLSRGLWPFLRQLILPALTLGSSTWR